MLKCVLGNPGMHQDKDVGILHGCAANIDKQEWPAVSSSTDVEYASKAPEVGRASHWWLWHKSRCLQNTEVMLGATTNREQTKQVIQNRGDDRDRANDVCDGLADGELLCNRVAGAEHSQLVEGNTRSLSWGWGPGNKCTGTPDLMAALGQRSKN